MLDSGFRLLVYIEVGFSGHDRNVIWLWQDNLGFYQGGLVDEDMPAIIRINNEVVK